MSIDPGSLAGTLLRIGGAALFLVTVAGTAAGLTILLVARMRQSDRVARWAGTGTGALLGAWLLSLVAGPIVLRGRTLEPGEELSFCGLDCHLHVTALSASRNGELLVRVRARSDARAVPEDPRLLDLYVSDGQGTHYHAEDLKWSGPLFPGDTAEQTLRFIVPDSVRDLRLVGTWTGWASWAVPGPDNRLVQRQAGVALAGRGVN